MENAHLSTFAVEIFENAISNQPNAYRQSGKRAVSRFFEAIKSWTKTVPMS